MTHTEFVEWQVLERVEPFGERRRDLHTAMQMALLAQIHRGKKGKKKKVEDFIPDWWRERSRQSLRQRLRQADSEARRVDGKASQPAGRRRGK